MSSRPSDDFIKRFAELAAGSDYSGHDKLRDVDSHDIRAAAEALWRHLFRKKRADRAEARASVSEQDVIEALLARIERYDDDNELVSTVYEDYWDQTDKMGFSFEVRQRMQEELTRKYLAEKQDNGCIPVSNPYGIWIFRFEE